MNPTRKAYFDCAFGQIHATHHADERLRGKRAILLLNSRPRSLLRLLDRLAESHFGVIVDIPGLGLSSPPPMGASMRDVADAAAKALDGLGLDTVDLFGLHSGHKVAGALAEAHPDRVKSLVIAGKTHSLIPDAERRNAAVADQMTQPRPDASLIALEGRYADDPGQRSGFESIFKANFAFDFAGALASARARTLILEITSDEEDERFGRQAALLAKPMADATTGSLEERDVTGLDLYAGTRRIHREIAHFLKLPFEM